MTVATTNPQTFGWLLATFVRNTHGVLDAIAVSADGLLLALSPGLDRADGDHLAAVVSGLSSLSRSASHRYDLGGLKLMMIEMNRGFLLVSAISGGCCLGVFAGDDADIGVIGYEIALLAERFGGALSPALISELREVLPR
ncbi:roadblock/LC7 domain-containing protein [Actinokineospora sp.]|uniref:roadblock/LC7 domain-containing protein n=1 Tax=Actinokineospora sp. TaxID=1872133 RepID=UPI003D6A2C4C